MIWPCRALKINHSENTIPFHFTYACFRLFGLSQYRVNITLVPQNCRMSYLVTIPRYPQVDFDISKFYNKSIRLPSTSWSPLVVVDTNSDEAVWISFYRPSYMFHVEMTISIFQRLENRLKELLTTSILGSESAFKWTDVHAGDYTIFVYVDGPHCDLDCGNRDAKTCQNCPHTMLNFTLVEDKFTKPYSFWNFLANIGKLLAIVLLVLLIISVCVITGVLVYYRIIRPKRLARRPPRNIELISRPSVLILYTDDCSEHSKVVMEVANVLKLHANSIVSIDQIDLIDPNVKPSLWLMNQISEAQYILLFFSEATKLVMSGEQQLVQRRPFPDLFSTAIRVKINEIAATQPILSNGLSTDQPPLDRFMVTRLAYSPPQVIPEFFSLLKCPHFVLPNEIGALLGHLHGIRAEDGNIEHQADLTELTTAIEHYRKFVAENPNWLEGRLTQKGEEEQEFVSKIAERLPLNPDRGEISLEDQIAQAEAYGLLPPDVEEDDEGHGTDAQRTKKYELVGTLDDISTSSSGS
uniref:SEFIR domain-containing protein n=1 Tax=Acrobeloides nanus TaxID=290746 RepID=A0A914D066_9BILA